MKDRDFEEQVVVVTGASGGVGAATARELAERGAFVVLAARRAAQLEEVRALCGQRALTVVADVTKRRDVERIFDRAMAEFGRVDVWINNVGRGQIRPVHELGDDDVATMILDNLTSALYGMQVVLPHLKERGTGAIVNVSSIVARVRFPLPVGAYAAAKAALSRLSEELRGELSESHPDVRVAVVYPGAIDTEFGKNALGQKLASRKIEGAQSAEEVAHVVCQAALEGRGDVHTLPNGAALVRDYLAAQLGERGAEGVLS